MVKDLRARIKQCKALRDLSCHFTTSEGEDADDESTEEPAPRRTIFNNKSLIRLRPSIVNRNVEKFVCSTPMHHGKPVFTNSNSSPITPIGNIEKQQITRESPVPTTASFCKNNDINELQNKITTPRSSEKGINEVVNNEIKNLFPSNNVYIVTSNSDNSNVLAEILPPDSNIAENLDNNQGNVAEDENPQISNHKTLTQAQLGGVPTTSANLSLFSQSSKRCKSVLTQIAANKSTQITDSLRNLQPKTSVRKRRLNVLRTRVHRVKKKYNNRNCKRRQRTSNEDDSSLPNRNVCQPDARIDVGVNTTGVDVDNAEDFPTTANHKSIYANMDDDQLSDLSDFISKYTYQDNTLIDISSGSSYIHGDNGKDGIIIDPPKHTRRATQNISRTNCSRDNRNEVAQTLLPMTETQSANINRNDVGNNFAISANISHLTSGQRRKGNQRKVASDTDTSNNNVTRRENNSCTNFDKVANNKTVQGDRCVVEALASNISTNDDNKKQKGYKRKAAPIMEVYIPLPRIRLDDEESCKTTPAVVDEHFKISDPKRIASNKKTAPNIESSYILRTRQGSKNILNENHLDSNKSCQTASSVNSETNDIRKTNESALNVVNNKNVELPKQIRKGKNKNIIREAEMTPCEKRVVHNGAKESTNAELPILSNQNIITKRSNLNQNSPCSSRISLLNMPNLSVPKRANHTSIRENDKLSQSDNNKNGSSTMSAVKIRNKNNEKEIEKHSSPSDLTSKENFEVPKRASRNRKSILDIVDMLAKRNKANDLSDDEMHSSSNANVIVGNRSNLNQNSPFYSRISLQNKTKLSNQERVEQTTSIGENEILGVDFHEPQTDNNENLSAAMSTRETRSKRNKKEVKKHNSPQDLTNKETFKVPKPPRKNKKNMSNVEENVEMLASEKRAKQREANDLSDDEMAGSTNANVFFGNRSNLNQNSSFSSRISLQNKSNIFNHERAEHTTSIRENNILDSDVHEPQSDNGENMSATMSTARTRIKRNKKEVRKHNSPQDLTNKENFKVPKPPRRNKKSMVYVEAEQLLETITNPSARKNVSECSGSSAGSTTEQFVRRSGRQRNERHRYLLPLVIVTTNKSISSPVSDFRSTKWKRDLKSMIHTT